MDRETAERELRSLRERAEAELTRLDRERRQLESLIALSREYAGGGRAPRGRGAKRRRPSRRRKTSLLELIVERPGIRASMLAMVTRRTSEEVAFELAGLEERGQIRREGLGWAVSG